MHFLFVCKRHYTNRDLIKDRFGRLFHLPMQLGQHGHSGEVLAFDLRTRSRDSLQIDRVQFVSMPYYRVNLPWVFASMARRARRQKPDVVIASGDINFGLYGLWLARAFNVPFVFDVYDQYLAYRSNGFPGAEALMHHVTRSADAVLTVSPALREHLQRDNPNVTVIDNGVDATLFAARDQRQAQAQLGLDPNRSYIGYFGSLEKRLGSDRLLDAVERLRHVTGRDVRLLLAGKNAEALPLDRPFVDYRGLVSQTEVAQLIAASDVVAMPYVRHLQNDFSGACKLAEYLCAQRPVAATDVGRARDFLIDVPLAEPGDVDSLVAVLRSQLERPRLAPMPKELLWSSLGARVDAVIADAVSRYRRA